MLKEQVSLAKEAIEHRLAGMNELREQITQERGQYVTRAILDAKMELLNSIEKKVANFEGRLWMLGAAITTVTIIIQILMNWSRTTK